MDSFFYSAVSDVLVGAGTSTHLGDLAASMGIQRALIVTDPGIIKFGLDDHWTNRKTFNYYEH